MYPLLSKLPRAPATLTEQFRTILLAAGHVAAGDAAASVAAFQHIEGRLLDKAYELCIVQAAPLVGIPRVLHAAAALQGAGIVAGDGRGLAGDDAEGLRGAGVKTFECVYGRNAGRVQSRLAAFHPALEEWILGHVYGALLSREVGEVSLRERELCNVAVLCGDACAGVQLASHLRGAVNVGASREEVRCVVEQTEVVHGGAAAVAARAVWGSYERARYAL